ncbi:MAG: purine-nucleoside phosphorylase, partial [Synergistaceae bacterium]|nr:purine-nucleoside phosphorylase [Synergistaceae bacterium]
MTDYDKAQEAVNFIKSKIKDRQVLTAIVLGSGLGGAADEDADEIIINAADIPNWPVSTAPGHAGRLIFKTVEGRGIVI